MTAPYRQLIQTQRYQIEAGLASDMSLSRIAKQIGAHPSTVSREVRRSSNGRLTGLSKQGANALTSPRAEARGFQVPLQPKPMAAYAATFSPARRSSPIARMFRAFTSRSRTAPQSQQTNQALRYLSASGSGVCTVIDR
jgi:hypothetical protein